MPTRTLSSTDVPRLIIEHNLHGIDIDPRCAQIAGLSPLAAGAEGLAAARPEAGGAPGHHTLEHRLRRADAGREGAAPRIRRAQFPAASSPSSAMLLETIFDKMQLAGEAGSLLKIEEEIRSAIADAKQLWKEGPQLEQASALRRAGSKQAKPEARLRTGPDRGITDEQFWEQAEERIYAALEPTPSRPKTAADSSAASSPTTPRRASPSSISAANATTWW